jgi:hypothetical protein
VHRTSAGRWPHFWDSGPNGGFGICWFSPPSPALAGNACRWAVDAESILKSGISYMSKLESNANVVFHIKAYKNSLKYWSFLAVVYVVATLFILPSFLRDFSSLLLLLLWICVMIINLAYFYRAWQTRLVIFPWGIEYFSMKFHLTSAWDNLDLAKNRTLLSLFSPIRLTSKKPIVKRNFWLDWGFDILYGNARFFIPMSPQRWDGYNELVELIKLHRPDLPI